jgi:hypothetical protein
MKFFVANSETIGFNRVSCKALEFGFTRLLMLGVRFCVAKST